MVEEKERKKLFIWFSVTFNISISLCFDVSMYFQHKLLYLGKDRKFLATFSIFLRFVKKIKSVEDRSNAIFVSCFNQLI